jgi:hypothetical protein
MTFRFNFCHRTAVRFCMGPRKSMYSGPYIARSCVKSWGWFLAWPSRHIRVALKSGAGPWSSSKGLWPSGAPTLLVLAEKWCPFIWMVYCQLLWGKFFLGLESSLNDKFWSLDNDILSASAHGQAPHTVESSGQCNFQGGCNYDILGLNLYDGHCVVWYHFWLALVFGGLYL